MVAKVLGPFRTPASYFAGGAALNRTWPRLSDDMDIFHDRRAQLPGAVQAELRALREAGFAIEVTTETEWMVEAILRIHGSETRVQWMDAPETSSRFFPALHDDQLGCRLHQADMAVNKVLCASRRREAPRDAVDLVNIATRFAPLGPLIWAAVGKDGETNPARLMRDIRDIAFGYAHEEIAAVRMEDEERMTRDALRDVLERALDDASLYCEVTAPIDFMGHLFVDSDETPIEADAEAIAKGMATARPIQDFGITVITPE